MQRRFRKECSTGAVGSESARVKLDAAVFIPVASRSRSDELWPCAMRALRFEQTVLFTRNAFPTPVVVSELLGGEASSPSLISVLRTTQIRVETNSVRVRLPGESGQLKP
jgi:hypothetical protein